MKKTTATILFVMILPLCIALSVAASMPLVIIDIDADNNIASITGSSLGSGDWATIHITAPDEQVYYVGSAELTNGGFELSFQMLEPQDGVYVVEVKTAGMNIPYQTSFEYITQGYSFISNQAVVINGKVMVKGNLENGSDKWVTILVYDEGDKIDYAADTICDTNGNFIFEYMSEAEGDLDVYIKGAGMANPVNIPTTKLVVRTNGRIVDISGAIPGGAGKPVMVVVSDDNGVVDYTYTETCDLSDKYLFQYTTGSVSSILTVTVNAQDLDKPLAAELKWGNRKVVTVNYKDGNVFNYLFSESDLANMLITELEVSYDADVLDVIDIDADMAVDNSVPGKIKFEYNANAIPNKTMNAIKFEAKTTGQADIILKYKKIGGN